jgi:hypothetical protein
MTQDRPKGASTGRLLLDQLVDSAPRRDVVGHDRIDGQMHSVDERRLAGRGSGGQRRPSRQEAGHRGTGPSGGVYGEIRNPSLIALTASGIIDALCRCGGPLLAIHYEPWLDSGAREAWFREGECRLGEVSSPDSSPDGG